MMYNYPKYLMFASNLTTSSYAEVASFAQTVTSGAVQYYSGEITLEQFNDGVYIDIPSGLDDEEKLQRTSINYIKDCIILGLSPPAVPDVEPLTGSFELF